MRGHIPLGRGETQARREDGQLWNRFHRGRMAGLQPARHGVFRAG